MYSSHPPSPSTPFLPSLSFFLFFTLSHPCFTSLSLPLHAPHLPFLHTHHLFTPPSLHAPSSPSPSPHPPSIHSPTPPGSLIPPFSTPTTYSLPLPSMLPHPPFLHTHHLFTPPPLHAPSSPSPSPHPPSIHSLLPLLPSAQGVRGDSELDAEDEQNREP